MIFYAELSCGITQARFLSAWTDANQEQFNTSSLDPNTTDDLFKYFPQFEKMKTKFNQYANFSESSTDDFSLSAYVGLYNQGAYVAHTRVFYQVQSGVITNSFMELVAPEGRCRDPSTLANAPRNVVIWFFSEPPFAYVNNTKSNSAANFSTCEAGYSLEAWKDLVTNSEIDYVRCVMEKESGLPFLYMKVKYRTGSGK